MGVIVSILLIAPYVSKCSISSKSTNYLGTSALESDVNIKYQSELGEVTI